MKVYKFKGDYKSLKELGYNRFNMLSLVGGIQLWGKQNSECTIVVSDYISVKPKEFANEPALTVPSKIKPYINDLIEANLVEISEMK